MIEKIYRDLDFMLQDIRKHVEELNTYVISVDDVLQLNIGWYCPSSNTYFYVKSFTFLFQINSNKDNAFIKSIYDNKSVRDELSIYLSNCRSKKEYDNLRTRINKLKSFW